MIVAWNGGDWKVIFVACTNLPKKKQTNKPASETDPLQQVLHCIGQVDPFQGPDIWQFEDFVEQMTETRVLKNKTCSSLLILLRAILTVDCG